MSTGYYNYAVVAYDSNNSQQASPLRELTCHMGSHSVTCHSAEVTFPPLPQPGTRFSEPREIFLHAAKQYSDWPLTWGFFNCWLSCARHHVTKLLWFLSFANVGCTADVDVGRGYIWPYRMYHGPSVCVLITALSRAKMAELIEMPFASSACVGLRNYVLDARALISQDY